MPNDIQHNNLDLVLEGISAVEMNDETCAGFDKIAHAPNFGYVQL